MAFAVLGLTRPDPATLPAPLRDTLANLAEPARRLVRQLPRARTGPGSRSVLTYDNARLPQALIAAGCRLGDQDLTCRGLEALDWYANQCGVDGRAPSGWSATAGGSGPSRRGRGPMEGDEQPLDAAALVEALVEA